jgi:hypothetical protein
MEEAKKKNVPNSSDMSMSKEMLATEGKKQMQKTSLGCCCCN